MESRIFISSVSNVLLEIFDLFVHVCDLFSLIFVLLFEHVVCMRQILYLSFEEEFLLFEDLLHPLELSFVDLGGVYLLLASQSRQISSQLVMTLGELF